MKKFIIIFVISLTLFIAALPYLAGLITYARYMQAMEVLGKINGIHLETVQYERKWFTSIATTHVDISNSKILEILASFSDLQNVYFTPDMHFTIEHKFFHGPLIFDKHSNDEQPKWHFIQTLAYSAARLDDTKHPHMEIVKGELARVRSIIHLNGRGSSLIESLNFANQDQRSQIKWNHFKGFFEYAPNFAKLEGYFNLPELIVKLKQNEYEFHDINFKTKLNVGKAHLWYGTNNFTVGKYSVKTPDSYVIFSTVNADSTHSLENKLVEYVFNLNISEFILDSDAINHGKLHLQIGNLNPAALSHLKNLLHEIDKGKITNQDFKILDKTLEIISQFLKSKPKLQLSYTQLSKYGPLQLDVKLAIDGKKRKKIKNIIHVLKYLHGEVFLHLPSSTLKSMVSSHVKKRIVLETVNNPLPKGDFMLKLARDTEEFLKKLEEDNIFVKNDDHYTLKASLTGDEMVINGKNKTLPF